MDARIIPFPSGRSRPGPAPVAVGSGIVPEAYPEHEGEFMVDVALEMRRLVHAGVALSSAEERAVLDRCLQAGLRALAERTADVRLAGTRENPMMEASFNGVGAEQAATHAVMMADDEVRRAGSSEYVISGAVASGRVSGSQGGVTTVYGSPEKVVARLCEKAAPGQVLLGGYAWERARGVDLSPGHELGLPSGPMPVFILRGLR